MLSTSFSILIDFKFCMMEILCVKYIQKSPHFYEGILSFYRDISVVLNALLFIFEHKSSSIVV